MGIQVLYSQQSLGLRAELCVFGRVELAAGSKGLDFAHFMERVETYIHVREHS